MIKLNMDKVYSWIYYLTVLPEKVNEARKEFLKHSGRDESADYLLSWLYSQPSLAYNPAHPIHYIGYAKR